MEGKFQRYFANSRIRIQEVAEGFFIKATMIGPLADMEEAAPKYFLAYPVGGYDTRIVYEGVVVNPKGKEEKVIVFKRYHSCE